MSNVKHSIANRLFAVILALVMVVGMLPTTALRAEAVEVKWISIIVKDGEGNPIEDAAVEYALTESDGTTPIASGTINTDAEGVAKAHEYSGDGWILSATVTAAGYENATLTAATVDADHLNFDVAMTATQAPQPPQTPKIEDVTIVAKSNLVYTGVAQDLVSVTEVEGDVITYEVDGGVASDKAQGVNAKSYSVKVTVKRTGYEDLVETVTATIAPATLNIDIEGKQLAYNEEDQELVKLTGSFEDTDTVVWTIEGQGTNSRDIPTGMAVGEYNITLTVERDNYNTFTKSVTAKIIEGELKLENLTVTGLNGVYTVENGAAVQQNAVKVENQGNYTLQYQLDNDGDLAVDENAWEDNIPKVSQAGSYIVWVRAVKAGYTTEDVTVNPAAGAVAPYNVYIATVKVDKPAADNTEFVYNTEAQTYNIPANELYTVSGNVQTDAGEYTVTVALKDNKNYEWADKTTANLTYTFKIEKASQTFAFDNTDYQTATSTVQISEVAPFANKTYNFKATDTAALANGTISYAVEMEAEDAGIATIDTDGLLTVTHPGVIKVIATLSGNENYEPCTIEHELQVTTVVAVQGEYVHFGSDSVDYIVGQLQGVASENAATKVVAADNGKITYSIANKDELGLAIDANTGKVTVANYTKLISAIEAANGTLKVQVRADKAEVKNRRGQIKYPADFTTYVLNISFQDTPAIPYTLNPANANANGWYNTAVTVAAATNEYTIAKTEVNGTATNFAADVEFSNQGVADRIVYLKDSTGGITAPIVVSLKIDTIDPDATNMSIEYTNAKNTVGGTAFYNPTVTITFIVADENGADESTVDYIEWFYDRSSDATPSNLEKKTGKLDAEWNQEKNAYTASLTLTATEAEQFRGNISFEAYDAAGNKSDRVTDNGKIIVVDNINPTMKAEHTKKDAENYNPIVNSNVTQHYYDGSVEFKFTIKEANFYSDKVVINVTKDGAAHSVNVAWTTDATDKDIHYGTFTLDGDGDYIVTMSYKDYSDNIMVGVDNPTEEITLYTSEVITIDETDPVIEFNYDEAKQEATIKVTEHNFRATEMALAIIAKNIKGEDVATTELLQFLQTEANWAKDGDVYTLVLDSTTENKELLDAIYQLTIGYTDLALNPAVDVDTGKFTVDHTAPDASKITIEYADATFIDKVLNTITLGFYKPNVKVNFTAYDITSGIKEFHWSYARANGASETNLAVDSGTFAAVLDGDKATATITLPRDQAMQLRGNITVDVVDFCGNGGDDSKKVDDLNIVIIDTIAPEISVGYNAPANTVGDKAYYNGDVAVEITVTEANFFSEDVIVKVSKNGAAAEAVTPTWADESVDVHKGTFTIKGDGHYIVTIEYTDKSDNFDAAKSSYTSNEITIDETAPVINVAYNNNSAANEKYFNSGRTATITITEHNFDKDKVIFTQNAARGGVVPTVSWSSSGDTHTATFVYNKDGDYTFDVTMTDLATNASAAANYGNSVAGKDFVVDTTYEDMITQNGVENGVAYGHDAEVVPNIKISDINLDEYTVTLTGVQKDTTIDLSKDVNALLKKNTETVTGVLDVFEVVQNLDGIYTLKMTSKDKAGNEDSMEIVFTVNRFGSVYVFEDYLLNLVTEGGAFVQKIDSDLVITEFNADKLVADSLKIEITVDGKPLENVQYTVTPEINDTVSVGSSGWYQYKYTISKDNFTADGVYKISVSSEDATGNTPENSNYEDKGMTFRVDSTKAEISSVVGLEEAIINAQEVTVKYTIFDTIGIKSIVVYVDGKPVNEITDFTADPNNYSGSFTLAESSSAQAVRIIVEDMAGNITDTDAEDFAPAYEFNGSVTVSTNIFVRWYANKPLFWGSIGGVVVVAGALWFFLAGKKKKKEEATAK